MGDAGLFEAVIGAIVTLFGVVWGGQRAGLIPTKDSNPTLTEAIKRLNKSTEKHLEIAEGNQRLLTEIRDETAVLRRQHGDEMPQGQFESWKNSPDDRRAWRGAMAFASVSAFMAEVALRMKMAEIEGGESKEFLGSARAALERHDSVRTDHQ